MSQASASEVYFPGKVLSALRCPTGPVVQLQIEQTFEPFTQSQAMRVRVLSESDTAEIHPPVLVLKLYDRRFSSSRKEGRSRFPWTLGLEAAAQEMWRTTSIQARAGLLHGLEEYALADSVWTDVLREEHFHRLMKSRFAAEQTAYMLLQKFQGTHIPQCFGAVCVAEPDDLVPHDVPEAQVDGLLLEYIDGQTLATCAKWPVHPSFGRLGRAMMALAASMPHAGVLHGDVRSANIMVTPDFSRIVLIDFGHAVLREKGQSDEGWWECVMDEDQPGATACILHDRNIRVRTPPRPTKGVSLEEDEYHTRQSMPRELMRRWFQPLSDRGGMPMFKDGVEIWLRARPWRSERAYYDPALMEQPRPHSPL